MHPSPPNCALQAWGAQHIVVGNELYPGQHQRRRRRRKGPGQAEEEEGPGSSRSESRHVEATEIFQDPRRGGTQDGRDSRQGRALPGRLCARCCESSSPACSEWRSLPCPPLLPGLLCTVPPLCFCTPMGASVPCEWHWQPFRRTQSRLGHLLSLHWQQKSRVHKQGTRGCGTSGTVCDSGTWELSGWGLVHSTNLTGNRGCFIVS